MASTRNVRRSQRPPEAWRLWLLAAGCALLLVSAWVAFLGISTLQRLAYELPTDFRLLRAREDLVHAALAGLAGVGFVLTAVPTPRRPS